MLALGVQCAEESHEIAPQTRQAINECVNPPDARENVTHRHAAARARLQLRAGREISLAKGKFLGYPDITWLEYQYFIDSQPSDQCLIPDHWMTKSIPPGKMTSCDRNAV